MVNSDSKMGIPPSQTAGNSARTVIAGMVGTTVEYFDFLVYATVSGLVFGTLFFPTENEFIGALLAISTFALGYLVRPIGGIVFSHFGDRHGRTKVLFVTLIIMGSATVLIGVLPTYSTIGPAAPVLLIALRIIQGLAVGGEYGGAAVLVVEQADRNGRRGLFGSFVTCSGSIGTLLASALLAGLTSSLGMEQFQAWGWRVPFLVSAVLLGVGFYIRLKVKEPQVMQDAIKSKKTVKQPLLDVLRRRPRQVAVALLAPLGLFSGYYIVLVFAVPYATDHGGQASALLAVLSVSQFIYIAALVFSGWWSDKIGRRVPMIIGAAGLAAWSFAFFPLLLTGSLLAAGVAFTLALVFVATMYGPLAAFLAELFPTGTRVTGLSFGYQISSALAGGLSPVIATATVSAAGGWWPVAILVAATSVVSMVSMAMSRDTSRISLHDHDEADALSSEEPDPVLTPPSQKEENGSA